MSTDRSIEPAASEPPSRDDLTHPVSAALRYQELFEFAPFCWLVTNHRGIILEANHAAPALLRCSKEFLIGKPLGLFIAGGPPRARFYDCVARLGRDGGSDGFETRIEHRKHVREVEVHASSTGKSAIDSATIRWVFRDVTDLREAEAARNDLLRRLVGAQENERRRIAREIHDQLGQELTGLTLGLKLLEVHLPEGSAGRRHLRELQEAVDRMGRESHEMALELHPTALDDLGLYAALDVLIRHWVGRIGVALDFHSSTMVAKRFPATVEVTVYRIVQEALTNIAKHARAAHASVVIEYRAEHLVTIIEDDGKGFDVGAVDRSRRLGLLGMSERVALVGGSLHIESSSAMGTTVRARIPCSETRGAIRG